MAIQSQAPSKAIITSVGSAQSGGTASGSKPVITGTADAGTIINVYDGVRLIGTASVAADGSWSFTPPNDLKGGKHQFTVISVLGDNWGVSSDQFVVTVPAGALPPTAPVVTGLIDNVGPVQGPIKPNDTTDDPRPAMTGTGTAGDTIKLYDNGTLIGSGTVGPDGTWSVKPTADLANGSHDIYATETNAAGTSGESAHTPFKVDTTTPSTPIVTGLIDNVGPITGPIPPNGTTDDPRPTMNGKGDAGDTVTLYDGDKVIGSATVAPDGTWTIKPTTDLADGPHDIHAIETNAAGVPSADSAHIPFNVDTTTPSTPIVTGLIDNVGPITGPIPPNGTTDDPRPTMNGKGDAGDTVTLYDGDKVIGTTTVAPDGTWTIKPTTDLADGPHDIHAIETNAAGVPSADSAHIPFNVDTTKPAAPVIGNVQDNVGPVTGPIVAGSTTDDPRPVVSGTGKAGDTVKLYDGTTLIGSATVGADGKWSITPASPLDNGSHSLSATDTNLAGVSSPSSAPFAFSVETGKPSAPVISSVIDNVGAVTGPITNGGFTDDTRPVINGTGKAGDTIKLYDGATLIGSATVAANGTWSIQPATALSNAAHSLTATDTNTAGTTSPASAAFAFTVDTTTPVAPAITSVMDNVGSIKGAITNGGVTDDARPVVNGTGKAGDLIKLYDGSTLIGSATVAANGTWSVQPANALSNAAHDLSATDTNAAGTVSPASAHFGFTVDTTTPATPAAPVVTDNGTLIPSGGTMPDGHPVISGSGKAGDTVKIYDGSTVIGSATIGSDGKWSFTPTTDLSVGGHDLSVIETNPAGTSSAPSAHTTFTVVTSAPVITNIVDAVGPIQGTVPNGGITDDNHPTVSGTGIAGNTVYIYQNGTGCGGTTVDATGHWSLKITGAMSEGLHDMTATQFPSGQPQSAASNTWTITIDTTIPPKPVITSVLDAVGPVQGNVPSGGTTDDTHPTVKGTGRAGDAIWLYDNGSLIGSVLVDGSGNWSLKVSPTLADGSHSMGASAHSATGAYGPDSDRWLFTVNTTTPATPAAPVVTDNGTVIPSGGTMPDGHPVISGTGKAGDTVKIYDGSTVIGSATIGSDGKWSFTPTTDLSNGPHDLSVIETNPAGTSSAPSAHTTFTVAVVTPAPVITNAVDAVGPVQGNVPSGGVTDDPRPTVQGTGHASDIIKVYDGSTAYLWGSTTVDASGKWSFTPTSSLNNATHNLLATATSNGIVSANSAFFTITVDTTTPAAPAITSVMDNVGSIKGAITNGGVTDDARPVVNGTGKAGDLIKLYDGSTLIGSATVAANGTWSVQPASALSNAAHDLSATDTNAAGTVSPASAHFGFTVDTTTPAAPAISSVVDNVGAVTGPITNGGFTDDTRPVVNGTGKAGDLVKLYDGSTLIGSATVAANGTWSIQPTTALSNAAHSLTTTDTNPAGTTSPASAAFAFTVDTTTPAAPAISSVVDNVGSIKGAITNGGVTDDARPVVNGTGKAGDLIKLYDGSTLIGSATVGADGKWSVQPATALSNAAHDLSATDTNAAGTVSPASAHFGFTVDTTTPATPAAPVVTDNGTVIPSGGTMPDGHPVISGTGKAGDTVKIYDGSTVIGSATIGSDGKWSFTPTTDLSFGAHDLSVIETNPAGTSSAASAHTTFTVALSVPVITNAVDAVGPVQGNVASGGVTDDARPTVQGTGHAGDIIKVYDGSTAYLWGSTTVDASGKWSFTPTSSLDNSTHNLLATATSNGTVSANSAFFTITVDTTIPPKPVITSVIDAVGPVQGNVPSGGTTDDTHPTVKGTGRAGDAIWLYDNGSLIGSVLVDGSGIRARIRSC